MAIKSKVWYLEGDYHTVIGPSTTYTNRRTQSDKVLVGVFHRPKPNPLDVTNLTVQRVRQPLVWTSRFGFDRYPDNTIDHTVKYHQRNSAADQANLVFQTKARFADSSAQLGESALSFRESCNMIRDRGLQLHSGFSHVAAGRWGAAAKVFGGELPTSVRYAKAGVRRVASTYLEFQWGWLPLLQDIYALTEALLNRASKGDYVSRGLTYWDPAHIGSEEVSPGIFARGSTTLHIGATVRNPTLSSMSALGVANPALIVWEALPFSFIVDWFFNVSTALANIAWDVGIENVRSWFISIETDVSYSRSGAVNKVIQNIYRYPASLDADFNKFDWVNHSAISVGQVLSVALLIALFLL